MRHTTLWDAEYTYPTMKIKLKLAPLGILVYFWLWFHISSTIDEKIYVSNYLTSGSQLWVRWPSGGNIRRWGRLNSCQLSGAVHSNDCYPNCLTFHKICTICDQGSLWIRKVPFLVFMDGFCSNIKVASKFDPVCRIVLLCIWRQRVTMDGGHHCFHAHSIITQLLFQLHGKVNRKCPKSWQI